MDKLQWIMELLPDEHRRQIASEMFSTVEEVRLRAGEPLILCCGIAEQVLWPRVQQRQLERLLQTACKQSVYAHTDTIRHGYLTVEGGHRIGICGTGIVRNKSVDNLIAPSSINIRIARERPGCAQPLADFCKKSMLILGPPGCGKTTLLRDLVRMISDRGKLRVGLADERGEVAAVAGGVPQMEVGMRTDILTGIPKADAVMMLLRTMNPRWVALDEITAREDIQAIQYASYCGVHLLATAHGADMTDLQGRPLYREMMETAVFSQIVLMKQDKSFEIKEIAQ